MITLSWVDLPGMAYSFIELYKTLHHNKAVIYEVCVCVCVCSGFYNVKELCEEQLTKRLHRRQVGLNTPKVVFIYKKEK